MCEKENKKEIKKIKQLLLPYQNCKLECDGFTRISQYILEENQISYQVYQGSLRHKLQTIPLHYWLELELGATKYTVDFAARMWLGESAPHGIFAAADFPEYSYLGQKISLPTISATMFEILTIRWF